MAKKSKVKKDFITFLEIRDLMPAIGKLRLETYDDNINFNRVHKLLQDEINSFYQQQGEILKSLGAEEKDGAIGMERNNPNFLKANAAISELISKESKLSKENLEFLTVEQFDWGVKTNTPITAEATGLVAKWCVREMEE